MSTTVQPPTSEPTPFYLSMRLTTHAEQRPTINFCGITYANESSGWAREDYIQPETQFDRYGNEIPRHAWIYASAIFTLAPYARSMKITVRCYDDRVSDTQLYIIEADEHKHVAEEAMREDIAHFVDAKVQPSAVEQLQLTPGTIGMGTNVDLQDLVTRQNTWWSLLGWEAFNTRAYPVGRRTPEEEEEVLKELHKEWQRKTGWGAFGRVEEGRKERLELHAGLDLVEL